MTLVQRLVEFAASQPLPPLYYQVRHVKWVLDIEAGAARLSAWGQRGPAPVMRRSGANPMPMLAVDTAEYVLGTGGNTARPAAFWKQLVAWAEGPNTHPAAEAVVAFAPGMWVTTDAEPDKADLVGIRICGVWLHQLPEAITEWTRIVEAAKGGLPGVCTACGQKRRLAASLPNALAAPVPGTRHQPQLLVTPKGTDVPVCVPCADRASAVLDVMLRDPARGRRSGDSATVAWGRPDTDADEQVKALLELLHHPHGRPTTTSDDAAA